MVIRWQSPVWPKYVVHAHVSARGRERLEGTGKERRAALSVVCQHKLALSCRLHPRECPRDVLGERSWRPVVERAPAGDRRRAPERWTATSDRAQYGRPAAHGKESHDHRRARTALSSHGWRACQPRPPRPADAARSQTKGADRWAQVERAGGAPRRDRPPAPAPPPRGRRAAANRPFLRPGLYVIR